MVKLTTSQQFLIFWTLLIVGLFLGSRVSFSLSTIGFITIAWGLIFLSGQTNKIEILSLAIFSLGAGVCIWLSTGGESWLRLGFLSTLSGWLLSLRDIIVDRFFLSLPEPHGSLLTGIIFGNRVKLDQTLVNQFRAIGISHIIAVSGYNLSILTANIQSGFRSVLGRWSSLLALVAIVLFVLISGAPASILRAAVMATLIIMAGSWGRPVRPINLIIITAGILALFEPKIIFQLGFQLSLAATYGVMRLSPLVMISTRRVRLPETLKKIMSETISAIVLTAPLLIYSFGQISLVSPLTNILVLPLIPMLMGFGLLATIGVLVYFKFGAVLALLTWPILQWIIWVSEKFSSLNWALIKLDLPFWAFALMLGGIIAATEYLQQKSQKMSKESE